MLYFYIIMKKWLILLFIYQFGFCQNIKPIFVSKTAIDADKFIGFDALGCFYFLKNNVFYKKENSQLFEYKNLSLGKPSRIDILNPLKIVLFYDGFNSVVTLDNQLNETQNLNFSDYEVPLNIVAVGMAASNNFWVFNALDNKIGLFDYLKKDYKSKSIALNETIKVYYADFNYFYFINSNDELYSCDVYGRVKMLTTISNVTSFLVTNNNKILYKQGCVLHLLNLANKENVEVEISEKSIKNFSYQNQILSIFTDQEINNYKINIE